MRRGDLDAYVREGLGAMERLDVEFEDLFESEDVTGLNAAWLRAQPGLLVVEETKVAAPIAERVSWRSAMALRQDATGSMP